MQGSVQDERRRIARHSLALPVEVCGLPGTTVNVSATGVLFESRLEARVGDSISFDLELGMYTAAPFALRCAGHVVRAIPTTAGMQVAATIEWIEHEC